jgi:hypothetical protein
LSLEKQLVLRSQQNDLGSDIRDRITKSDIAGAPQVSLRDLQRDRAVNKPGSKANKAFMANKEGLSAWNSKRSPGFRLGSR